MSYVYLYLRQYLKKDNHISICENDNDNIINKVPRVSSRFMYTL